MKKRHFFGLLLCVLTAASVLAVNGDMGGGNGSESTPYLIEDLADFDTFADTNNAATYWAAGVHTQLTTDIDLSGRIYTTAVIGPVISLSEGIPFKGIFDGNGKVIYNLTIDGGNSDYMGLFGLVEGSGAAISNLGLVGGTVTGYMCTGCLAGRIHESSISKCYATNNIVNGLYWFTGGLIGDNLFGDVINCYATSDVTGDEACGGLSGGNNGTIVNCYATGNINGNISIGGLVGYDVGSISNCYANGEVAGNFNIGGLVGYVVFGAGSVSLSYWDVNTSGIGSSGDSNLGAIGKTTAQMMTQNTFTNWDFSDTDGDPADWMMLRPGEDYPRLAWQEVFDGDIAGLYGVDMVDFAYLANYWQLTGCNSGTDCGRADIDTSGTIDLPDLAAVANDWLVK